MQHNTGAFYFTSDMLHNVNTNPFCFTNHMLYNISECINRFFKWQYRPKVACSSLQQFAMTFSTNLIGARKKLWEMATHSLRLADGGLPHCQPPAHFNPPNVSWATIGCDSNNYSTHQLQCVASGTSMKACHTAWKRYRMKKTRPLIKTFCVYVSLYRIKQF